MKFSRNRGNAGRHTADGKGRHVRGRDVETDLDDLDDESDDVTAAGPEFGPYDVAQAPSDKQERLDLGALRIPAIAGVEIQLEAGSDGQIQQIMLVAGESRLQLGVFAAPRTEGIWDELRANLRTTLAQTGARQEDVTGDYGPEIMARIRDGSSTVDVRHVGIDGPRWFLHAVYFGAAAGDPTQAGALQDVMRGLVVDRGTDARPVSEALPLRLPPQAAAQLAAAAGEKSPAADAGAAKTAPAKTAPAKTATAKTATAKTAPAKTATAKTAPAKTGTAKTAPAETATAKTAGTETATAKTAGTETAGTETAGTEPAGTEPAGTEPAGTEPAGTETAGRQTTAARTTGAGGARAKAAAKTTARSKTPAESKTPAVPRTTAADADAAASPPAGPTESDAPPQPATAGRATGRGTAGRGTGRRA